MDPLKYCFLIALFSLLPGCKGEEPEFEGRPVSEWVAQANGKGPRERIAAYQALRGFPSDATALTTLREAVADDKRSPPERYAAAQSLYRITGNPDDVIGLVRSALHQQADGGAGMTSTKELEDLVFWLGEKGKPLIPDLQYAASKVQGRDAAARQQRETLQKLVASMSK